VTHSLFLGEFRGLTEIANVDTCFALSSPCVPTLSPITFSGLLVQPLVLLSFGRFLYAADEDARIVQANLDHNPADPNAGRVFQYAFGLGSFPTGLGADPVDGLQVFVDPGLRGATGNALATRLPLCPPTP
jgi:hypothetical protein